MGLELIELVPIGFGLSLIFCIYFLVKDIIKVFKGKGGNN